MAGFSPNIQQEVELAKTELRLALMFAKVSSAAYSTGRLQHASDARSKAEAVRSRAVAQLTGAVAIGDVAVGSMLDEVQEALACLPSSSEPYFWTRFTVRRSAV